ncbi:MAG: alpha/beta hydrolase-fold protein [Candidatus Thorarchaeota archaeon]
MNEKLTMGENYSIESKILGEERKYTIYLPEDYEKSDERYSVLFVVNADYQAYFVHAASVAQLLFDRGCIPPMIVVGVHTKDHAKDFFPVPHPRIPDSGKADLFLEFILTEIRPLIANSFRTNDFSILYGVSNSGMFTVYTLLTHPDAFNGYIAGSPMLGWATEVFHEKAQALFSSRDSLSRYLYMEYGENDYDRVCETVPDFAKLLDKMAPKDLVWSSKVLKNVGHGPITVLYNGLSMIFPEWQVSTEKGMELGMEGVESFYASLSARYSIDVKIPSEVLSDIGIQWILKEEAEHGRPFIEKLVELYPTSEGGYYLLGIIEERMGNFEGAADLYRKALELNPEYPQAKEKLAHLKNEGKI